MSQTLPIGTKIYIRKQKPFTFNIRPDQTLLNDNLYVAYDVKYGDVVVIPAGTRVVGDWVTESNPISAQFQLTKIILKGAGQVASADSPVYNGTTDYNNTEVLNSNYLYKRYQYKSVANIERRIVSAECMVKVLRDQDLNTTYLEITTTEIPVILTAEFTPCTINCC